MTERRDFDMKTCPEHGAPNMDGVNCWAQLGAILVWEYQDPELRAEHFLVVAAYNVQHPAQFTEEAWAGYARPLSNDWIQALP